MIFLERVLRRLGAVTPSSPGRDFRRFAGVSRSLDHENVACGSGATRLVGTRRRNERFHFDVAGSLTVFGDGGLTRAWPDLSGADKATAIAPAFTVAEYDTKDDVTGIANVTGLRYEGATIEHPDVNGMLKAFTFQVRSDPGDALVATISVADMQTGVPSSLFTQSVVGAGVVAVGTTAYRIVFTAYTELDGGTEYNLVKYPCLAMTPVLHFSTDPVAW